MSRTNRLSRVAFSLSLALASLFGLTGCSPVSVGFVALEDGKYVLQIPERCGVFILGVTVQYASDSAPYTDLWTAKADAADAKNAVVLFEANDGYAISGDPDAIDLDRELLVMWSDALPQDTPGSGQASGVLADLEPGEVLWIDGIVSADSYKSAVTSPFTSWRCRKG